MKAEKVNPGNDKLPASNSSDCENNLAVLAATLSQLRDAIVSLQIDMNALRAHIEQSSPTIPRTSYTTAEVAVLVKRSDFQVRKWCREYRILAEKKDCGRGPHGEWSISADEVARVLNEGLLPVKEHARATK